MKENGIQPNLATFNLLIKMNPKDAKMLYEQMKEEKIKPTTIT